MLCMETVKQFNMAAKAAKQMSGSKQWVANFKEIKPQLVRR